MVSQATWVDPGGVHPRAFGGPGPLGLEACPPLSSLTQIPEGQQMPGAEGLGVWVRAGRGAEGPAWARGFVCRGSLEEVAWGRCGQ